MRQSERWATALLLATALALAGCTDAPPSVTGLVQAPDGEIARARGENLWARFSGALAGTAWALTGLDPVGEGVEVRLQRIDGEGRVSDTLVTVETFDDSMYYIELASAEQPSSSLIVSLGSGGTLMRAFVSGGVVGLDPASEATVRLVLDSEFPLGNYSASELADLQGLVNGATADVAAGNSIAAANDAAEEAAAEDPEVRAAIAAAGAQ